MTTPGVITIPRKQPPATNTPTVLAAGLPKTIQPAARTVGVFVAGGCLRGIVITPGVVIA